MGELEFTPYQPGDILYVEAWSYARYGYDEGYIMITYYGPYADGLQGHIYGLQGHIYGIEPLKGNIRWVSVSADVLRLSYTEYIGNINTNKALKVLYAKV